MLDVVRWPRMSKTITSKSSELRKKCLCEKPRMTSKCLHINKDSISSLRRYLCSNFLNAFKSAAAFFFVCLLLLSVLFYFLYSNSGCTLCTTGCPDLCTFRMCNVNFQSSVTAWNGMARQHVCLQERARAETRDIPASLIVYNLMVHHEY